MEQEESIDLPSITDITELESLAYKEFMLREKAKAMLDATGRNIDMINNRIVELTELAGKKKEAAAVKKK